MSTSLTISEVHSILISGGVPATDFDAFICNSGSDLYYPSPNSDEMLSSSELPFAIDEDYHSQIEYRWGGEGLRKTLVRWAASVVEKKGEGEEQVVIEDEQRSSTFCHAFNVKNPALVNLLFAYGSPFFLLKKSDTFLAVLSCIVIIKSIWHGSFLFHRFLL